MIGQCTRCGRKKEVLTKHSLIGGHKPPFIRICRLCHNKIHNGKCGTRRIN